MCTPSRWSSVAVLIPVALLTSVSLVLAQPAAMTAGGADRSPGDSGAAQATPLLTPGVWARVTTVDLARFIGHVVSADADRVEVRLSEGKRAGELVKVPLGDVREIEVSQGQEGRGRSALLGATRMAIVVAPLMMLWGAVDYDAEDLQYGSPGEGAFYGLLTGAILGGAIGAPLGALVRVEKWKTVPGSEYRHGVAPRRPTVPYRFASVRGGWNGQWRKEGTDPLERPSGGLSGGSGALGYTIGIRVSDTARLEFEFWRPERIAVSQSEFPGEGTRTFRDYSLGLSIVSEFKTTDRVRPYWLIGINALRVDEQGLSERKSYGGLLSGIGMDVSITRHLAVSLDGRINYPVDVWYLIDPYEKRMSFRPSVGMVVRF